MSDHYKITFLLDRNNDWLAPFIGPLVEDLNAGGRVRCIISYFAEDVAAQDVVFILGYTRLLSEDFLSKNKLNLVIHESALPAGKGFSPVQWQVLDGANSIPVSLIEAVNAPDAGDIFEQTSIELDGFELWPVIRRKQAEATVFLVRMFLEKYPSYSRRPQSGQESFFRRRTSTDDRLDETKSLLELFNHFRIADNERFPVFFEIEGHRFFLKISDAPHADSGSDGTKLE